MSASAARCPHCGAVQSRAADVVKKAQPAPAHAAVERSKPALKDVTSEEARALLAISEAREGRDDDHDDDPGLFAALLLPHPRSAGPAWAAEVVLTVVALPLILASMLGAFFAWRSLRHADRAMERGLLPRLVAIASGVGMMSSLSLVTDLSSTALWSLIGACCAALLGRAGIRMVVRGKKRKRDLTG
jgi:hypothetical protein